MQVASDHSQGEAVLPIALLEDRSRRRQEVCRNFGTDGCLGTDGCRVMALKARDATVRRHGKSLPRLNSGLACA